MLRLQDSMGELYDLDVAWHTANGTSNADCAGFEYYSSLPRQATINASINVTLNVDMQDGNHSWMAFMCLNLCEHVFPDVEIAVIDRLFEIVTAAYNDNCLGREHDILLSEPSNPLRPYLANLWTAVDPDNSDGLLDRMRANPRTPLVGLEPDPI